MARADQVGAAPARRQRDVHVDAAEPRHVERHLRQRASSVRGDDRGSGYSPRSALDAVQSRPRTRLEHRHAVALGELLDGQRLELEARDLGRVGTRKTPTISSDPRGSASTVAARSGVPMNTTRAGQGAGVRAGSMRRRRDGQLTRWPERRCAIGRARRAAPSCRASRTALRFSFAEAVDEQRALEVVDLCAQRDRL